jgi:hypothetical protein
VIGSSLLAITTRRGARDLGLATLKVDIKRRKRIGKKVCECQRFGEHRRPLSILYSSVAELHLLGDLVLNRAAGDLKRQ